VGSGTGAGGTASAGYADRVRAKVQPNINFYDDTSGNPIVTVLVQMAPDGTVLSRRVTKPSGYPVLDEAVLRAIDLSSPLPRDTNGKAPASVIVGFKPKRG
ncbi:TonB family protein, partial [Ralstonia pseudosolanacearum]